MSIWLASRPYQSPTIDFLRRVQPFCAGDISHNNARLLSKSTYALGPRASSAVCGSLPARARHCRRPHRCEVRSGLSTPTAHIH